MPGRPGIGASQWNAVLRCRVTLTRTLGWSSQVKRADRPLPRELLRARGPEARKATLMSAVGSNSLDAKLSPSQQLQGPKKNLAARKSRIVHRNLLRASTAKSTLLFILQSDSLCTRTGLHRHHIKTNVSSLFSRMEDTTTLTAGSC